MKTTWFGRLEEYIVAFLLAAMTLVTFVQVVARYVFNYSFVWAFELTTWLFAGMIFLGISYGIRVGAHVGVDALINIMPNHIARIITIDASESLAKSNIVVMDDRPKATATGMPMNINRKSRINRKIVVIIGPA